MKVIKIIIYFLICVFLYGCDTIAGARMTAYNINVPIEEIYNDIMENNDFFKYTAIELEYSPQQITYDIYPNKGERLMEAYYYIRVFVYGFNARIYYIDSNFKAYNGKVFLYVSANYLNPPSDVEIFTAYKLTELKQFLKEKYNLVDEDIIIKSDFYKNRAMPDYTPTPPEVRRR
jgi:hypothetical protein